MDSGLMSLVFAELLIFTHGKLLTDNGILLTLNTSVCDAGAVNIHSRDDIFKTIRLNSTSVNPEKTSDRCLWTIDLSLANPVPVLSIGFVDFNNSTSSCNISVIDRNANGNKIQQYPFGDSIVNISYVCLKFLFIELSCQVGAPSSSEPVVLKVLNGDTCQEVLDEEAEPPVGRKSQGELPESKSATKQPQSAGRSHLDVIIITGVAVTAVIGMIVAGFSIRRWIRSSVEEERRQSQIRVNSQNSHTRSTTNSLSSGRGRFDEHSERHDREYGTIRSGGRLPSSEDDSDLFGDTKSTKTDVDEL